MNYEKMMLLDVLVSNMWKNQSYTLIFRIDNEFNESEFCMGSFTAMGSRGASQYEAVNMEKLKRDYIYFFNQNKAQSIQDVNEELKRVYAEDNDVQETLFLDTMLVNMCLFLEYEDTHVDNYLLKNQPIEIIYNARIGKKQYDFYIAQDVEYMPLTLYENIDMI